MVSNKTKHKITGTLIWYYYICQREVWLMSHSIEPDQENPYIELGRLIEEESYSRDKRIHFSEIAIDLVKTKDGNICVGEIKKSSRAEKSASMQLAFYLLELEEYGITAKGELLFPKEKKKVDIVLTEDLRNELTQAIFEIDSIIGQLKPPPVKKCKYCTNCAYNEFCWA
ncbi:MAG TPA: CRISPR-associated protein Cas4 [Candidatus Eremiobacteraeota bacterium]|nr:CRISPR-associated protein Cas4 [Candidatus Eremiobacteraeota bacterium]